MPKWLLFASHSLLYYQYITLITLTITLDSNNRSVSFKQMCWYVLRQQFLAKHKTSEFITITIN